MKRGRTQGARIACWGARIACWGAAIVLGGAWNALAEVDFNREVRPILSENCFYCHGPDEHERKSGLRLDTQEGATAENEGVRAVVPGDLEASELWWRVVSEDEDELMPPADSHKKLTEEQRDVLKRWIVEGAAWAEHWAFVPPDKPELPGVKGAAWGRNEVDAFVLAALEERGMEPSPEGAREVLLRRVSFDLTGLPPTLEEVDAFLEDREPGAYERAVDHLLGKQAFGERMALAWMDIARYGDSSVMHADGPRTMWPWRDWVIEAYNSNMGFDQFTVEQVAGDLIEGASVQQKIASAFNRNHASSDEGGAIPEELRVEYVVDRVQTTANAWMGLSVECAQCHDHKYDPISQREYYEMFAYFNTTKDPGMQTRNGNQEPVVKFFPDEASEERHRKAVAALRGVEGRVEARKAEVAKEGGVFETWAESVADRGGLPEPGGLLQRFVVEDADGKIGVRETVAGVLGVAEGEVGLVERGEGDPGVEFKGEGNFVFPEAGEEFGRLQAGEAFTLAAWVKAPDGGGDGAIVSRMDEGNDYLGWDLWMQGGSVGTHLVNHWPDRALKVVSKERLKKGEWQHVVLSYDGSRKASGVEIYIDGKRAGKKVEKDKLEGEIVAGVPVRVGKRSRSATFSGAVSDIRVYGRKLTAGEREKIGRDAVGTIFGKPLVEWSKEEREKAVGFYLEQEDSDYLALAKEKGEKEAALAEEKKREVSTMIMSLQEKPRATYVLDRGAYDAPREDEEVFPGVPRALPALPDGAPANRLGLAKWLVDESHPLTARVAVNRYWAMLFGQGLVKTVADFGSQGSPPSHPELLDWLARDFVESGWDIKRAIRRLVTSATYRQSSGMSPERLEADPENLWLARGPRFRLQGEFVRDNALSVSGLLVDQVGGESVKPYQPAGLWNEVSLGGNVRFVQDKGEKLYRKSLYTYWKRSAPHPGLMAFDAPTREKCVVQRARTNTPLQALVTLNDVQFVESARAMAERVLKEGGEALGEKVEYAWRLVTGREPDAEESLLVAQSLGEQMGYFRADAERARDLLATGESPRDESLDAVEHAAWTNVCSLLLNLDEVITRG